MAVLGLRFCARAFSTCRKWGPLFIVVCGPLTTQFTFYKNEIDPETTPVPPPKFKLFIVISLP